MDVSAMLVANIHFRVSTGVLENMLACWPGGREAYMGSTSTLKEFCNSYMPDKHEICQINTKHVHSSCP